MGIPVLILGESGSGKSTSMRNFDPDEVGIFNVASKPLPFRKKMKKVDGASYGIILTALKAPKLKTYVIDDSQYHKCIDLSVKQRLERAIYLSDDRHICAKYVQGRQLF